MTKPDYSTITESPGLKASREQIARIYHRYRFAWDFANSKDVLEVACGTGMGLGFLSKIAKSVTGGDIDKRNMSVALNTYEDSLVHVREMDAHDLPFADCSLDLILLFEAIYYLREPEIFLKEAVRTLRGEGTLIICTVNKDWADFHPSPYVYKYYSAPELFFLLKKYFEKVDLYGAFSTRADGILGHCASSLKRIAVRFNLVPDSLSARTYLKRLFIGSLQPLPNQVFENMASYEPPLPIPMDGLNSDYKIIYAVAQK
jgi:SAM-dependent methyltransferase